MIGISRLDKIVVGDELSGLYLATLHEKSLHQMADFTVRMFEMFRRDGALMVASIAQCVKENLDMESYQDTVSFCAQAAYFNAIWNLILASAYLSRDYNEFIRMLVDEITRLHIRLAGTLAGTALFLNALSDPKMFEEIKTLARKLLAAEEGKGEGKSVTINRGK